MELALIGYGKMGKVIEKLALQRGHNVNAAVSPRQQELNKQILRDAQVCIDFSHPDTVVKSIRTLASLGKNVVVGTTGWDQHADEVRAIVEQYQIGLIYSPNFSIGVHLFMALVSSAAELFNHYNEYDICVTEAHHRLKADSPSGTALAAANILLKKIERKKTLCTEALHEKIVPEQLQVSSTRCGSIPGTHSVIFDSPIDTITITHEARNREGFAHGAITAAEWLQGKKGFFTIHDMLGDIL